MIPAGIRRGYADTRLGQLHYATAGSGTPLVLLPQGGRTWPMFATLMRALAPEYRTIAIDYPGSGGSDALPTDASYEVVAAAIVDAMDALGVEKACLYGLHTGNKIGAALAAGWPERLHGFVFAGQSHSIVPSNEARSKTVGKFRRKLLEAEDPREAASVHRADVFNVVSGTWWSEAVVRQPADVALRAFAIVRSADEILSAESMPALYRANYAFDLHGALSRIRVPTLVLEILTAVEDRTIGRQGEAVCALVPGAELATIPAPDVHGVTLEDRGEELSLILRDFFGRLLS